MMVDRVDEFNANMSVEMTHKYNIESLLFLWIYFY